MKVLHIWLSGRSISLPLWWLLWVHQSCLTPGNLLRLLMSHLGAYIQVHSEWLGIPVGQSAACNLIASFSPVLWRPFVLRARHKLPPCRKPIRMWVPIMTWIDNISSLLWQIKSQRLVFLVTGDSLGKSLQIISCCYTPLLFYKSTADHFL